MTLGLVVGGGGHAKVVAEALDLNGIGLLGHVAPTASDLECLGPHLGDDTILPNLMTSRQDWAAIPGMGFVNASGRSRFINLCDHLRKNKVPMMKLVHPSAVVSPSAYQGNGSFIAAGALICTNTRISNFSIVNTGAIIDHDSFVDSHCHIGVGARLCGNVSIGSSVLIGAGAVIRQGIHIGANAIVGAGAVVVEDVSEGALVLGIPAKPKQA